MGQQALAEPVYNGLMGSKKGGVERKNPKGAGAEGSMGSEQGEVEDEAAPREETKTWMDFAAFLALGIVLVFVIAAPGIVMSPIQRTLVFLVVSVMAAIVIGRQVARITINLGWLIASYGGSAAVVFGLLFFLTKLSSPQVQVAVFHIQTPMGEPYSIEGSNILTVNTTRAGLTPTSCVQGNTLMMIFPEQTYEVEVGVKYPPVTGQTYFGKLRYSGSEGGTLKLGSDLTTPTRSP